MRNTPRGGRGALAVKTTGQVETIVAPATDETPQPCRLCPLCACGYPCCLTGGEVDG
jgi:hypothetical protein